MIRSKWASVALATASFVATTAGIAGLSSSASAEDVRVTEHTYSGGVKSSLSGGGAKEYHLNSASPAGPGYVEGVGDNRTHPRISGKREGLVVHFQIAKETKPYAFLSRVVTSMTLRVEAPLSFSGESTYSITLYCTSQVTDAWHVLG